MGKMSELAFSAAAQSGIPELCGLIFAAYGEQIFAMTAEDDPAAAAAVLQRWMLAEGNRFSLQNIGTCSRHGELLGMWLAYDGERAAELDEPLRAHLRSRGLADDFASEGKAGERYIDALAVSEAARGRGVGAAMLAHLKSEAAAEDRPLALLVEPHNPALRLYERVGFVRRGELLLPGHTRPHLDLVCRLG